MTRYRLATAIVLALMIPPLPPCAAAIHSGASIGVHPQLPPPYVVLQSASDAGEYGVAKERRRDAIHATDLAKGRARLFADGIRNPVGMATQPASGRLSTAPKKRDVLLPEPITAVRDGGFYGWPYGYWGKHPNSRLKGQGPNLIAQAIPPDFVVGAMPRRWGSFSAGRQPYRRTIATVPSSLAAVRGTGRS